MKGTNKIIYLIKSCCLYIFVIVISKKFNTKLVFSLIFRNRNSTELHSGAP